ncbi:MAG: cyclic nucleotide-binding domain-containing protein [Methylococcales bacterium]|nr:cyclic nucleotide-binding domain-containing protein [Methylococcales bacterium]
MSIKIDSPDGGMIRQMIPFSTMSNHIFRVICRKIVIETVEDGGCLFKRGDSHNELIYLLEGSVSLEAGELKLEMITAGSESAKFAVAHQLPRKIDAFAQGDVRFLRLDAVFITSIDTKDAEKKAYYEIQKAKKADSEDCKSTLFMIPVIRALSPIYLRKISEALEEISVEKDEIVIEQGGIGQYFYLIKKGECLVSYKSSEHAKSIKVEKLDVWNTFGDMAMILGEPYAETITALFNMQLLQIRKDKFLKLIKEPSLTFIDFIELELWQDKGAVLLDIRSVDEYDDLHLPTALNVPLFSLGMHLRLLAKNQHYIIVCEDGKASEAAAFLMKKHGFDVKIIRNGLNYVPRGVLLGVNQAASNNIQLERSFVENLQLINPDTLLDSDDINDVLRDDNRTLKQKLTHLKAQFVTIENEKRELERSLGSLSRRIKHSEG